jgi:hypothetical protein
VPTSGLRLTGLSTLPRMSSKERLAGAMAKETEAWIYKGLRMLFDSVCEPGEQLEAAESGVPTGWHFILRGLMPSWAISFERCVFVTDRNVYLCRRGGLASKPITVIVKYPLHRHNLEVRGRRLIDRNQQFLIIPPMSRAKRGLVQAIAMANRESRNGEQGIEQQRKLLCLRLTILETHLK